MNRLDPRYTIGPARDGDLAALAEIERAAGTLLLPYAPPSILDETTDVDALREARAHGRLWVARDADGPVGFAIVCMLAPGHAHLAELDVHPDHGRRGIGTALVRALCAWSERSGCVELTLTTFRRVRWNMPFYAGLGFAEVPAAQLGIELRAVVADETARGLDPAARVAMRYEPS
ncbi:MAG TPA: GNAT family N-acetyltransferase [Candidatus Binatia bacterium]|jgi:GNAT superfamily N-acetyltransferase